MQSSEVTYDYLLWRREYVFRDQWSTYLLLVLLYYVISERKLWIMLPILGCAVTFNVVGYYYLFALEQAQRIYDDGAQGQLLQHTREMLNYLLWRREYIFRDAWISYSLLVVLCYTVGQRKVFVVMPALLFAVLLNLGSHWSLYSVEQSSGIYNPETLQLLLPQNRSAVLNYLLWRREYIFRDEWLCYGLLITLYYVLEERRWKLLSSAIAGVVVFNAIAYHHLALLETGIRLYGAFLA